MSLTSSATSKSAKGNQAQRTLGAIIIALAFLFGTDASGAFGLTTNTDFYTVDTGAGLVFKVRRVEEAGANANTISIGDIRSLVYNGVEYQDTSRGSQINSGFDYLGYANNNVSVTAEVVNTNFIKVTVTTANLIHYYIARNGYPHIYMATWFSKQPLTGGELCRYIVRMPYSNLPNGPEPSDISQTTTTVESGDIFGMTNGETRSKHYSNHRLIDWDYTGATGNGVGVFMVRDSQEGGSGGPFYRSLINQGGGDQEITYIINYGEAQTEAFRTNILNGIYSLVFTDGQQPDPNIDYSWVESAGLNLVAWVPESGRGHVAGTASGIPDGFETVIGFANANAQYWAKADADGAYISPPMIPGTYTATLYKQELGVATDSVTVAAGNTNTLDIASTESHPSVIWRIGEWDGSPRELRNGDKMTFMHPSDVRMDDWNPWPFNVDTDTAANFPCVQFRGANTPAVITFNLTSSQIADLTLRIGTTCAYNNGRPQVTINSTDLGYAPYCLNNLGTRSITVGTYRGINITYSFTIPSSALVVGQNTLYISPVSGSLDLGTWLSASWAYDAIELGGPPASVPPAPVGLAAINRVSEFELHWTQVPLATHYIVRRSTTADGPFVTLSDNVGPARFVDSDVINGTTYFYRISAANILGEGGYAELTVAPSQLITHLKFDESAGTTAEDSAGDNDGTLKSGASWTGGQINNAVQLNGTTNGYVELPDGLVENLTDCTISTWVNASATPTWSRIFDFGMGTESYMFLSPNAYNGGSGTVRFAITLASNGAGSEQQLNSGSPLSLNGWHHIAVTLSGNTGKLYIDGSVADTQTITLDPADLGLTRHDYIGKSQWGDTPPTAKIDDFRIYSRALSAGEIATMASQIPPSAPASLTASATTNDVALNWPASSGAATYNIKRSNTNGGPYTLIAGGIAGTSYTHFSEQSGWYHYVVTAENQAGESAPSPEAELLVIKVPAQPVAAAAPAAYYRFEGGTSSSHAPVGATIADSSGNGQTFNVFSTEVAPTYNSNVPTGTIPQTSAADLLSLSFDGGDDLYGSIAGMGGGAGFDFTAEAYVQFSGLAGFQTVVGRDDFAGEAPGSEALFYLQKTAANALRVYMFDNTITLREAKTGDGAIGKDIWYHIAAVGDASAGTLKLYLNGNLVATSPETYTGMFASSQSWTIGRGFFGGVADNVLGKIDEVRFCHAALSPEQFLNASRAVDGDSDLDGLSDVFENYYFGNLAQTGTGDWDGDGVNNAAEQANGSNPTISSIPPHIDIALLGGTLNLNWPSNNTGWILQYKTNGLDGAWLTVPNSETNNAYQLNLNTTSYDSVFFRLIYPQDK